MSVDYKQILFRFMEKLVRQRNSHVRLGLLWRAQAENLPPNSRHTPGELTAKAWVIEQCAKDDSFIIDRAASELPPDMVEAINRTARANEDRSGIAARQTY